MKSKLLGIEIKKFSFWEKGVLVDRINVLRIFNGRNTAVEGYLNVESPSFSVKKENGKVTLLAEDSTYKKILHDAKKKYRSLASTLEKTFHRSFKEDALLQEGSIYTIQAFGKRLTYIKRAGERFTELSRKLRAKRRKNTQIIYI